MKIIKSTCPAVCVAALTGMAGHVVADDYTFTLVDSFITIYDLRECYLYDINNHNIACGTATIQIQTPQGSTARNNPGEST